MSPERKTKPDKETLEHVANALWQRSYSPTKIPAAVRKRLADPKNSPESFGSRLRSHLDWLIMHQESFTPNLLERYQTLKEHVSRVTPHQAYAIASNLLGGNNAQGYDEIPNPVDLKFPRDHAPQLHNQVGWHFIVGSAWDKDGQEYGIECMFFRFALLPPELAKKHGLTDLENQVIELQFGISKAGDRHYQADPVLIAGTSGLIKIGANPLNIEVGKNRLTGGKKGSLWPLKLKAWGLDKGARKELAIDLTFSSGKGILPQGDAGAMPSIDGTGSKYYSIPNLQLKAGSTVRIGNQTAKLTEGSFWFDHQWGFLSGNPRSAVMRAAGNLSAPSPGGWDWFMAQFIGNRQLTMFALHSHPFRKFYFQSGPRPPGAMTVDVAGKYMDAKKRMVLTRGTLTVDSWVKSEQSPNPKDYPISGVWHPDRWRFEFDTNMPEDIRSFVMTPIVGTGQTNYFANGTQYSEGAVYLKDPAGDNVGRGFAESVLYADSKDTVMSLAKLPPDLKELMTSNTISFGEKLKSLAYVATHKDQLAKILKSGKGMEYMSGADPKRPSHRGKRAL